jgi:hypothetical protein
VLWEGRFSEDKQGLDVLDADREILYPDTCIGALVGEVAGEIALECAKSAGAEPAEPPVTGSSDEEPVIAPEAP